MSLDFSKLTGSSASDTATEPRRIFSALPKRQGNYGYPRDVQTEVWEQWHARRSERDLVIKMNTGAGKTIVGLVLLKSCLNEGMGPAAYFTPGDIYLTEQVRAVADELGLETCNEPRSSRFLEGNAILVDNIFSLVNGQSQFGVKGDTRQQIKIGSLVIDDAHACLSTVESQFTLRLRSDHPAYRELLGLFEKDLSTQSAPGTLELKDGVGFSAIPVPYWAWADRQEKVLQILHPYRSDETLKWTWPLIANCLPLCRAGISTDAFEIAPPVPPIDRIPSLASAARRVYMTATLVDDSVLVTHFGAESRSVEEPITPKTAGDLGDRMILTPLETHPGITDEHVRDFLVAQAKRHNVVVIVPSWRRAEFWRNHAAAVYDKTTIRDGVATLRRNPNVGLVVLVNKYDGIDLPGPACRILALDGLPEAYSTLERIDALVLEESEAMTLRQLQRIEQGMGRGIRSSDDYCVVLLLGSRLTQRIHTAGGLARFSPATRAQLELSRRVAGMLHGRPFAELEAVVDQCLNREEGWVRASRDVLDGVQYGNMKTLSDVAKAEREAFDLAEMGRYVAASDRIQAVVEGVSDRSLRGWLKQSAAAYLHHANPVAAQELQVSAQSDNKALLKPRAGVAYNPLNGIKDQAERASSLLKAKYPSGAEFLLALSAISDDLVFDDDQTAVRRFEQAVCDLGSHLGFPSHRPELDTGLGPDVLWAIGERSYLVIECKSGVSTDFISKHDAAQLSNAIDWFRAKYDASCEPIPVMIHRSSSLHKLAVARSGTRVLTTNRLVAFLAAVSKWANAVMESQPLFDTAAVGRQLTEFGLNGKGLPDRWTVAAKKRD